MKNKLNAIIYTAVIVLITSCSASKSAMAQSNNDQYNNGYNQQPPPPSDQGYNNNNGQNYQSPDQSNQQNNEDYDDQNYTNDNNYNNGEGYDNGSNGNNDYNQGYNDGSSAQAQADVNMNDFNTALSPYGTWMDYPAYGRVWVCGVPGFRPYYSGGHWAYTNFGWTWASDYAWGWAPFHYGRWAFEAAYGWMWVPGYQWGPAWVGWRTGGAYYGWAPLGPGMRVGIGFGFGGIAAANWCFVPHAYIGSPYINRYFVNSRRNVTLIRNTTVINNTHVYGNSTIVNGPSRMDVERYTGRSVQQMRVVNTAHPAGSIMTNNNTVGIYRPHPTPNYNRPVTPGNVRPNAQQFQGSVQQRNMNNLPQRGNMYQQPNQNFQQPRQNLQPQQQPRQNFQPQPQVQQPRTMPSMRPGSYNNYRPQPQQRNFAPQPQQSQRSFSAPAAHQFASGGNFGGGSHSGGRRR